MPLLSLRFAAPALVTVSLVSGMITASTAGTTPHHTANGPAHQPVAAQAETIAAPLSAITSRGESALDDARDAIAASKKVTSDIAASGLSVTASSTVVDTSLLSEYIGKLESLDLTPTLLIPALTKEAAAETQSVREQTAALRGQLDAAIQKKADEEAAAAAAAAAAQAAAEQAAAEAAAAQARAEEEAAAAAAAAAAPSGGSASSSGGSASYVDVNVDPGSAQGIAQSMMASSYGWGNDQFQCLVALWNKESGWRVNAANPSGAYGIPQALPGSKMSSAGADWETNPATQIAWGLGYISGRYGSPCGAWDHSQSVGWY